MEKAWNLRKDWKYLVGASGGSDSMTLLSLCLQQGYDVIVAHVNYRLRENADKEEQLLKKYCEENHVPVFTLYPKQSEKGNFQNWARVVRYQFYQEVYQNNQCDCLLLGHQLDDHIESYLMAKQRKSHGWYYGIREETQLFGMKVIRPLLSYRKSQTRQYCLQHQVPFGDDESNFTDHYTRNRIRHQFVEKANDQQIEMWLKEIQQLNQQIQQDLNVIQTHYDLQKEISIQQFNQETPVIKNLLIRKYFLEQGCFQVLSNDYVQQIISRLQTANGKNGWIDIDKQRIFVFEYGLFYITKRQQDYRYQLESIEQLETAYFKLSDCGETIEGVTLKAEDFPIVIRNAQKHDSIALRYGHKKINRFFIDRKMLYKNRIVHPVIENRLGEVIFVKDIGCDVNHYSIKPNLFMIK